ncbi:cupin domain-containing protein [Aetokthonos hydrillicola Thurmond2011]|jgi:anti-sigma factor ChrR (cupin superfamily)|uniref:Cupin domain-containing protein n=1 Tax=Aetokthonos hydrillicola Thurmond2011 TaxID=2712845 RepID=A0AAP5M6Y8_9CYAN|nr:cupin domain-containing protein [Aetokthonos hydrillicola]MBO3460231.1 anti-sigma factor [Aetokthonos hydrillicola CCALA 1050]MBW4586964.1 cupin domain-containing protein [Aetokthonos hydrillicola CCALA 1050]MDR9897561.1 cupin domain-containing protein [Aetokthonos hydrillicola Thurmond2011]
MNTENYCFCELAPLYVLDLLSEAEKSWVEQQLAESPELAEELAEYEIAATAIPYSAPIVPMATNLKAQLFANLELEELKSPIKQNVLPESIVEPKIAVRYQDIQWQPHTVSGVEISIFHTDLIKREIVGVLRAEPGAHYPLHRHAASEEIYMLEGDLVVGDEVYGAFDYIRSEPGSSHAPYTTGGCMFFFRTSMDDEYLEW